MSAEPKKMASTLYPYINSDSVEKLLVLVDRGLGCGVGSPSTMLCVESAWWLARGGDPAKLSDENECVGNAVRHLRALQRDLLARSRAIDELPWRLLTREEMEASGAELLL